MTCLEAQSKIITYIENKLERNDKENFLKHIKQCRDCREELNIYYTMIEGMRQLDANEPLSKDFDTDLENKMAQEMNQNRKKRDAIRGSVVIIFVALFSCVIFGYVNFLNYLVEKEQQALKDAQGEYYYSASFDDILFEPYDDMIVFGIEEEPKTEDSFYKKVRKYNYLNVGE